MAEPIQSQVTAEEVGHTVVDVEGLVNSMKDRLDSISVPSQRFHICRVPAHIRKDNHVYYNPKIVSIGPFHRPKRNLRAMEEHKWRYLQKVIHRVPEPYELLKSCVIKIKNMEEDVRKCYSGNMSSLGEDEFVKMILLDGFFVIQILLFREENNPIENNEWVMPLIAHDMLLLENQLPFSVLNCLANLLSESTETLKKKAIEFFFPALLDDSDLRTNKESPELIPLHETNIHHLLHLVLLSLKQAPPPKDKPCCAQPLQVVSKIPSFLKFVLQFFLRVICSADTKDKSSSKVNTIPTATELAEAGVLFKRNEEGSLVDVTFKNGVMRLPRLRIADNTKSLFRNIIAFEQCFRDGGDFTSYCLLMDSLVNTERDVQILKQSDIIENLLGSDEEVALFFNPLCKEIAGSIGTGSVGTACQAVNQYATTRWHKWRARLMHDYFSHPWAVISLIAAVYVIFLTSVQTYYAAF